MNAWVVRAEFGGQKSGVNRRLENRSDGIWNMGKRRRCRIPENWSDNLE